MKTPMIFDLQYETSYSPIYKVQDFLVKNTSEYFNPHPSDAEHLRDLFMECEKDRYFGMYIQDKMVGYGMLRGMDEGYEIPSLGICIDKDYQGFGLGRLMMEFLHAYCRLNGYSKIRLAVHKDNLQAIKLYESMFYEFSYYEERPNYLLGFKEL